MFLVTSNPHKLAEFQRFGVSDLRIKSGLDLPEIDDPDPIKVVVHKALAAGPGHMVEDTSLDLEGMDVGVNVRWLTKLLADDPSVQGRRATWTTLIAAYDGDSIAVWSGSISGRMCAAQGQGWGFDALFVPDGAEGMTLAELDARGEKDRFSARKAAVLAMLSRPADHRLKAAEIPAWEGAWQDEAGRSTMTSSASEPADKGDDLASTRWAPERPRAEGTLDDTLRSTVQPSSDASTSVAPPAKRRPK